MSTIFAEGVFSSNQLKSILPSTNRRGQPQTAHQVKNQAFQMPGFRARWWNYAKRGYWHLEHDRPTEALEDFNTALSIKPHDQWTARTYGLHFEEYFAQRGKGIALLELKQYDESIQALKLSIEDATSEKALYFLRKAKLEKRLDVEKDRHPPEISITAKSVRENNEQLMLLFGTIQDDGYLKRVSVDGISQPLEPLSSTLSLRIPLEGKDGLRVIHIEAEDGSGKVKSLNMPIFIDRTGPTVSIDSISSKSGKCTLKLRATDPSGLSNFSVNGKTVEVHEKTDDHFTLTFMSSDELLTLHTSDQMGNVSKTVIPFWGNP